jgi:hypothetical protein
MSNITRAAFIAALSSSLACEGIIGVCTLEAEQQLADGARVCHQRLPKAAAICAVNSCDSPNRSRSAAYAARRIGSPSPAPRLNLDDLVIHPVTHQAALQLERPAQQRLDPLVSPRNLIAKPTSWSTFERASGNSDSVASA